MDVPVREAGTGTPVLLLHGVPGPASIDPLVTHLSRRHRVLAPTHPGWDGTRRPGALTSPGDLAQLYLDLLRQTETEPVAVLGASFGGWIAAEIAVRDRNERVERLILMDAIGPEIPGHPIMAPTRPSGQPAPAGPPTDAPRVAGFREYTSAGLHDSGLLSRLASVACPVLAVWGEHDTMVSPEFGRAYAGAFPRGRFQLIPGAGHLPIREQPEATFAAVDAFLSGD